MLAEAKPVQRNDANVTRHSEEQKEAEEEEEEWSARCVRTHFSPPALLLQQQQHHWSVMLLSMRVRTDVEGLNWQVSEEEVVELLVMKASSLPPEVEEVLMALVFVAADVVGALREPSLL